jgi:predicted TIM-barrel fold metal-dependent hydrolase
MIIDGHAHVTRADYGSAARLRERMDRAGIDRAVLVPGGMIDVRRMTAYLTGQAQPEASIPNDVVEELIAADPARFLGFYCVNPNLGDAVVGELRAAIGRGFSGLKLAPMVHRFPLTSPTVGALAEACGELGVPFYSHVIGHPSASTDKIGALARQFPQTTFILGHMGFGPADDVAIDVGAENDNVFLETSGGSFLGIEGALARLGPGKLIFGSEFPMHHPQLELEKLRLMASGDALAQITGGNLQRLLGSRSAAPRPRENDARDVLASASRSRDVFPDS